VNWRDVRAKARSVDPAWDNPERVERRRQIRDEMIASVNGALKSSRGSATFGLTWPDCLV
jgi:hypothetical protein